MTCAGAASEPLRCSSSWLLASSRRKHRYACGDRRTRSMQGGSHVRFYVLGSLQRKTHSVSFVGLTNEVG